SSACNTARGAAPPASRYPVDISRHPVVLLPAMSGTVRAEAPGRLFELVRALGGSPERVLAAAGVTAANFADPDRPIEVETALRLMDAAAHEVGDDHFGLHAGGLMDYGTLGVLTYAGLNAP